MFRHVIGRARAFVVLAVGVVIASAAIAVAAAQEPAEEVRAAGADIQAADAPTTPHLVRRDALQEALERRAVRARVAQEGRILAGTADAKAERYAVEPRPEPPAANYASGSTVWDRLARCESGGNWASSAGLYEGGLQFHPSTWDRNKPAGYPDAAYQASREQQIQVAERVLARQGWGAWPACASELGLR